MGEERQIVRKVSEKEARWVAQSAVGSELNLLRAEGIKAISTTKSSIPPSDIPRLREALINERNKLLVEKKGLRGVEGEGEKRHELAERIQQLRLDINFLKRKQNKSK